MANCINQQMMEQMLTKMEEVFAQMIVNVDAAIVRVFDRMKSDEETVEPMAFQSDTRQNSVDENSESKDSAKSEQPPMVQEPERQDTTNLFFLPSSLTVSKFIPENLSFPLSPVQENTKRKILQSNISFFSDSTSNLHPPPSWFFTISIPSNFSHFPYHWQLKHSKRKKQQLVRDIFSCYEMGRGYFETKFKVCYKNQNQQEAVITGRDQVITTCMQFGDMCSPQLASVGILSCGFTHIVVTHLDIVKCKMQIEGRNMFDEMPKRKLGSWNTELVDFGNYLGGSHTFTTMIQVSIWLQFMMIGENDVSWNLIITGLVQWDYDDNALKLFKRLETESVKLNFMTMIGVYSTCKMKLGLEFGRWCLRNARMLNTWIAVNGSASKGSVTQFMVYATTRFVESFLGTVKMGVNEDTFVSCALVGRYSKCGNIEDVQWVFDGGTKKTTLRCNFIFTSHVRHVYSEEALSKFDEMHDFIVKMVYFTFSLKICSRKWGRIENAQCVIGKMSYKNIISENALMVGYGNLVRGAWAVELFKQISLRRMKPYPVTVLVVLCAPFKLTTSMWAALLTTNHVNRILEFVKLAVGKLYGIEPEKLDGSDLKPFAYKVWNEVVRCFNFVKIPSIITQLLSTIKNKLGQMVEIQIVSSDGKERQGDFQPSLCGVLLVIIQKLNSTGEIKAIIILAAIQIMILLLKMLGYLIFRVHEKVMFAIGTLAYMTGFQFEKCMPESYKSLERGMQNYEEYCVYGDNCRVLENKVLPIFFCSQEIAFVIKQHFEEYVPYALSMKQGAAESCVQMEITGEEMLDYDNLTKGAVNSIFQIIINLSSQIRSGYASVLVCHTNHIVIKNSSWMFMKPLYCTQTFILEDKDDLKEEVLL